MEISPQHVSYVNPVGETGLGVRGANRHNSALRVYVFEAQHKAAQRRKAENRGLEVENQDVKLRFTADDEGRIVASGGETSTDVTDEAGNQTQLNELALLSEFGKGSPGASAAAFFGDSRKALPQLFLFDSYASRLAIENRADEFDTNISNSFSRQLFGERQVNPQVGSDLLSRIESRLSSIEDHLSEFNKLSPFVNRKVTVSDSLLRINGLDNTAVDGRSLLEVKQLAQSQQVAFDVVAEDNVALGVGGNPRGPKGNFKINGVEMTLKTDDTLLDLKNLINRGEDSNGNNVLDFSEDRNFNHILDAYEDSNGNGLLDTSEDIDADGVLDAGEDINLNGILDRSEDRNFNFKLDKGTELHGVHARIEENKLILQAIEPDGRISIEDDDRLLETLGLRELNYAGESVFKNEVLPAQKAELLFNNSLFVSDDNNFNEVIQGVDFSITSHLQKELKLDVSFAVDHLLSGFGNVVEAYDLLQEELNVVLKPEGVFRDNAHIQRIKNENLNAYRFETSPPPDMSTRLSQIGVTQQRNRVSLDELAIRNADLRMVNGEKSVFDIGFGVPTVRNSMGHFAITSSKDGVLTVDDGVLSRSLEMDVENTELLIGKKGFSGRLVDVAQRALSEYGGHISFVKQQLLNLEENNLLLETIDDNIKSESELATRFSLVA